MIAREKAAGRRLKDRDAIALATGIAPKSVANAMSGKGNPTIDTIERICRAFRVQPWEMMVDDAAVRRSMLERILQADPVDDSAIPAAYANPRPELADALEERAKRRTYRRRPKPNEVDP